MINLKLNNQGMMDIHGIEYLITVILITAFLAFSKRMSKKRIQKGINEEYQLRLNDSYKWMGYIGAIIGFAISVGLLFTNQKDSIWVSFFPILIFSIPGTILLMWYFNHQLTFDEKTIRVRNWIGKSKELNWNKIENIKFNSTLGYLQLFSGSDKINIHFHLVGLIAFLRLMENKTNFKATDLKIPL